MTLDEDILICMPTILSNVRHLTVAEFADKVLLEENERLKRDLDEAREAAQCLIVALMDHEEYDSVESAEWYQAKRNWPWLKDNQ